LRIALPHIVRKYVNKKLDEMPEYDGRIGDVDIHLWRGAYSIQGIEIIKTEGDVPVPFFSSRRVMFSVDRVERARSRNFFCGTLASSPNPAGRLLSPGGVCPGCLSTKPDPQRRPCIGLEPLCYVLEREEILSFRF
jgi:hypothetical protein